MRQLGFVESYDFTAVCCDRSCKVFETFILSACCGENQQEMDILGFDLRLLRSLHRHAVFPCVRR